MTIKYPWWVWFVLAFNAVLFGYLGALIDTPFNFILYGCALVAAIQAFGFFSARLVLNSDGLRLRHFFQVETIARSTIQSVDAGNFRAIFLELKSGAYVKLPSFRIDNLHTAKALKGWLAENV